MNPTLEIIAPDGSHREDYILVKDCTKIGRYHPPTNDIALQPDPQRYVTREMHGSIDREGSGYYIVKHGRNAILLGKAEDNLRLVQKKLLLRDGDRIYIRGGSSQSGKPLFWQLVFRDGEGTRPTDSVVHLDYDEISGQVVLTIGDRYERKSLPVREDKLLHYMIECNREHEDTPTLVSNEDLMQAVWEDEAESHSEEELHKLISSLRKSIELNPTWKFLINERGRGYRLKTHVVLMAQGDAVKAQSR